MKITEQTKVEHSKRNAIEEMRLNSVRFEIEAEMFANCAIADFEIGFVPIVYRRRIGEPKLGSVEHAEWQTKMNDILGLAEIIIGKQRHGPTGNIKVEFESMYTRFKDLDNKQI